MKPVYSTHSTPTDSGSLSYWKRQAAAWELRARRAEDRLRRLEAEHGHVFTQSQVNEIVATRINRYRRKQSHE